MRPRSRPGGADRARRAGRRPRLTCTQGRACAPPLTDQTDSEARRWGAIWPGSRFVWVRLGGLARPCDQLRVREERMVADPAPAHAEHSVDLDPFERRASIRPLETPCHRKDAWRAFDALHTERRGPCRRRVGGVSIACRHEVWEHLVEDTLLAVRWSLPVGSASVRKIKLQRFASSAANRSIRPSSPSTTVVRPAAISASASRSIACQRSVQNHA